MSLQDGISDMLTRMRNAIMASAKEVSMPTSAMKSAVASVLKEEGYISDFYETGKAPRKVLTVKLKYFRKKPVIEGMRRVSRPSCRIYCGCSEIPKVRNGLGTVVMSTPAGIISGRKAAKAKVGGEIVCTVW